MTLLHQQAVRQVGERLFLSFQLPYNASCVKWDLNFNIFINKTLSYSQSHVKPHEKPLALSCCMFFADIMCIFSSVNYNNHALLFYCS